MKERFAHFVGKLKTGLKNLYYTFWLCLKKKSESLFLKRRREQIALVALVPLLKRMKRIIRSCRSFKKSEKSDSLFWKCKEAIHSFLSKNERFARKTKERIPHPDYNLKYLAYFEEKHVTFLSAEVCSTTTKETKFDRNKFKISKLYFYFCGFGVCLYCNMYCYSI